MTFQSLAELRDAARNAILSYAPKAPNHFNEPTSQLVETLRGLPFVVDVSTNRAVEKPAKQIVHILDRRFINPSEFAKTSAAAGKPLGVAEFDREYEQYLMTLEAVQIEQMAVLRCLALKQNVRWVYVEGLTPEKMPWHFKSLEKLREMAPTENQLREFIADDERELTELAERGETETDEYKEVVARWTRRQRLAADAWKATLVAGAVVRVQVADQVPEALPLDDDRAFQAAKPVIKDGKLEVDGPANDAREEAMVKRLLADESPVVFVVLNGRHDLGERLASLELLDVECVRVTCRAHQREVESD